MLNMERVCLKLAMNAWLVYLGVTQNQSIKFSFMLNLFGVSVCKCFTYLSLYISIIVFQMIYIDI